jgi:hypothetical protein
VLSPVRPNSSKRRPSKLQVKRPQFADQKNGASHGSGAALPSILTILTTFITVANINLFFFLLLLTVNFSLLQLRVYCLNH